ncbi:MAG: hypothetical protein CM1200mP30_00150 [Pseudomonadota bacterium]|nr:MAG: hypothetical protein CM1200mP30_00150 [Pseudomonadota bacterium]
MKLPYLLVRQAKNGFRSSMAIRTSSSQSMSSGIKVTIPDSNASAAEKSFPLCSLYFSLLPVG